MKVYEVIVFGEETIDVCFPTKKDALKYVGAVKKSQVYGVTVIEICVDGRLTRDLLSRLINGDAYAKYTKEILNWFPK